MTKIRFQRLACMGFWLALSLFVACSSDPTCGVEGATSECLCPGGLHGAQVCLADGTWGTCQCGPTTDVTVDVAADLLPVPPMDALDAVDDAAPLQDVTDEDGGDALLFDSGDIWSDVEAPSDAILEDGADFLTDLWGQPDSDLQHGEPDGKVVCNEDDVCDPGENLECPGCAGIAVAAGALHTCALRQDKSVWCWGDNMSGELGVVLNDFMALEPQRVPDLTAKAIGTGGAVFSGSSCAVDELGGLWCWGAVSGATQPTAVGGAFHGETVCTAWSHACALTDAGTVACWGDNGFGQVGNGKDDPFFVDAQQVADLTAIDVLSCGDSGSAGVDGPVDGGHACAVDAQGVVWCWGAGTNGQLGDGLSLGSNVPVEVPGLGEAVDVAAGGESVGGDKGHTCAALADGTVWCWGTGWGGQLGDGLETASPVPVQVSDLTEATQVSVGGIHSCALVKGGTIWCWGHNFHGQLGNGTQTNSPVPVMVADVTDAVAVSAGKYHTCAVLVGGGLRCWGNNDSGQLGDGGTAKSKVPVEPISF